MIIAAVAIEIDRMQRSDNHLFFVFKITVNEMSYGYYLPVVEPNTKFTILPPFQLRYGTLQQDTAVGTSYNEWDTAVIIFKNSTSTEKLLFPPANGRIYCRTEYEYIGSTGR